MPHPEPGKVKDGVVVGDPVRRGPSRSRHCGHQLIWQLRCAIEDGHMPLLVSDGDPFPLVEVRHLQDCSVLSC